MGLGNRMCLYKLSSLLKIVANKMNLVMITGMFSYNVSNIEKVHINLIFDIFQVESNKVLNPTHTKTRYSCMIQIKTTMQWQMKSKQNKTGRTPAFIYNQRTHLFLKFVVLKMTRNRKQHKFVKDTFWTSLTEPQNRCQ
jgi:hypothetical protein